MLTRLAIVLDKRRHRARVDVVNFAQIEDKRLASRFDFSPERGTKDRRVTNIYFAGETKNLNTALRSFTSEHQTRGFKSSLLIASTTFHFSFGRMTLRLIRHYGRTEAPVSPGYQYQREQFRRRSTQRDYAVD